MSHCLRPHGLHSPWNSSVQITAAGSRSHLQRIFPAQGWNHIAGRFFTSWGTSEAQEVGTLAMQQTWVQSLDWEDPLEKEMTIHFRILAWRIPWTEEPGGVHGVVKSRTWLRVFHFHFTMQYYRTKWLTVCWMDKIMSMPSSILSVVWHIEATQYSKNALNEWT